MTPRAGAGYTRAECLYLLSPAAQASAYGESEWEMVNGAWLASWPVAVDAFAAGELDLRMRIIPGRWSQPTVLYIVRGDHMRRVDVNGWHGNRRFTHLQGADQSGELEHTTELNDWSVPGINYGTENVSGATYHRVLEECAKVLAINTAAVTWLDPPQGDAR